MISATPGSTVAATMTLPKAAVAVVKWVVRDPAGNVVADGQQPATGTLVALSFVMPSDAMIPLDGTNYSVVATDGVTTVQDSINLVSSLDPSYYHSDEIAYVQGKHFVARLIVTKPLSSGTVTVASHCGGVIVAATNIVLSSPQNLGNSLLYTMDLGVVDTGTAGGYGMGSVVWDYVDEDGASDQALHAYWTITNYSSTYLAAIRKLVDRAKIGDANRYMNITTADLANALIRGMEYVAISPPMLTPFSLDQIPITLRDYVIKAAAVDFLRAQYLAEGMSAFDMQGLGVQLNVDRSQYLDSLAQQLNNDLQGLPAAKKAWQQQGSPMGGCLVAGVRPIGILALTTGVYSNYAVTPQSLLSNGYGYSFFRYGAQGPYN
jgi:hypothetical protein